MSLPPSNNGRVKVGIALRNKAAWVHHRLTQATRLNTHLGEETITETLLLDLALELGPHLAIESFTKYVESHETGADWEWWFCDGQAQPVFGMRVQAKKLKRTKAGVLFYDLAYKSKNGKRQVDRLCDAANAAQLPAIYALYNGPELDLDEFAWKCCKEVADRSVFGVSMLSGDAARVLADKNTMALSDVGSLSLPWSCCALCPQYLGLHHVHWPPDDPIPDTLGDLALWVGDMVTGLLIRDADTTQQRPESRADVGRQGFRTWEDSPEYVRSVVNSVVENRGELRQPSFDNTQFDLPRDLAGISVWVAQPIEE